MATTRSGRLAVGQVVDYLGEKGEIKKRKKIGYRGYKI
jgi:hypothetical protein